jgi:hypothetical protein
VRIHSPSIAEGAAVLAAVALLFAEMKMPAVGIDDSASTVRGALGVTDEYLGLDNDLGKLSFLLNGGFALLSVIVACFALAKHRRKPSSDHAQQDHWGSGDVIMDGAANNAIKHI